MAIEPLSSVMTYAAQPVARPVTQSESVESSTAKANEGQSAQAATQQVDGETLAMARTQESDGDGGQEGQAQSQGQQQPSNDAIKKALDELAKKQENYSAEFGIHEKTNRITVKIVDKKTKEVVKELPPEKTLDMIAKVWEYAGLIVDDKR